MKNKRVMIGLPEIENGILEMVSAPNPKADGNKTNNAFHLMKYGLVVFLQNFKIKTIEQFKKEMEIIRKHNEGFGFNLILEQFYNTNKMKGGQKNA